MSWRAALLAALLAACDRGLAAPRAQIVLHVTTDAPLPLGTDPCPSQPRGIAPLFDTVEIDVLAAGQSSACDHCARRFALDCTTVDGGKLSMGIVPTVGEKGWRARVRLFRSIAQRDGAPIASAALDTVVELPTLFEDEVADVTVTLLTDSIGAPVGTIDAPAPATRGTPKAGLVGSWSGAKPTTCSEAPPPDEACVFGGAFWMGNPAVGAMLSSFDADIPRLVVLSPFYMDTAEVTVAEFRASGVAHPWVDAILDPGDPYDNDGAVGSHCTYSNKPAVPGDPDVGLPVNCLTWSKAKQYCEAVGKLLPTEAQYEYVASGLRGASFVWGEDDPECAQAVFARGATPSLPKTCPQVTKPLVGGGGSFDRIELGGRVIVDLAGNLREWTRDVFAEQTEDCWTAPLLHDPECTDGKRTTSVHTVRGGSWRDQSGFLRAATRHFGWAKNDPNEPTPTPYVDDYKTPAGATIGFRCVRPAN